MKNDWVKLLVAGLCAATFMAVLVWLVRSEGQRTRQALREASRQTASRNRSGGAEYARPADPRPVQQRAEADWLHPRRFNGYTHGNVSGTAKVGESFLFAMGNFHDSQWVGPQ